MCRLPRWVGVNNCRGGPNFIQVSSENEVLGDVCVCVTHIEAQ